MDAWGVAVVAVGSAIAGGLPGVWFARTLRDRPPEQPSSLSELASLYTTVVLGSDRTERQQEVRRERYLAFLELIDAAFAAADQPIPLRQRRSVSHARDMISLIGPVDVAEAAQQVASLVDVRPAPSPGDVERARGSFLTAARRALNPGLSGTSASRGSGISP